MKTFVIITFQLEGIHNWPEAKEVFPDVNFLSDVHRHMFHFKLCKRVNHDDRDVEFIRWKRHVINNLREGFRNDELGTYLDFGRMSCEQIAKNLMEYYDCEWVEVFEDGENGARVEK